MRWQIAWKQTGFREIMKFMLKCEEAAHYCDKLQYNEASPWEKFTMKLHHLFCRICKEHSIKNTKLTRLLRRSGVRTLSSNQKEHLKERLRQEMSN